MLEERGRAAGAAGGHRQEVAENPPVADYPASYQQVSLGGMAAMSADASRALNLTFCCHVRGCLDVERLHQAFVAVQLRHDALRSTFRDSALCQVQSGDCLDFLFMDPPADLAEWVLDQQYEPFDLCNGPLCRVRVIKESSDAWILHWTLHHVAADLWSYTLLLRDLGFAYDQLKGRSNATADVQWPTVAPSYGALSRASAAARDANSTAKDFWRRRLSPRPPSRRLLPLAEESWKQSVKSAKQSDGDEQRKAKTPSRSFKGSKVDFELSRHLSEKLIKLGEECEASLHAILLAAWMVLLSRYAEEDMEDMCIGTPLACRNTLESESCVGYFVTPVCIRASVRKGTSFRHFLSQICQETRQALQFQDPNAFGEICEELNLDLRDVLQAIFVFQSTPDSFTFSTQLPSFFMGHEGSEVPLGSELHLESMALGQRYVQFDLAMMMAFCDSGSPCLIGNLQYCFTSYSRETVLRLQAEYQRLLERIVAEPSCDVAQIQFVHPEDLRLQSRAISPWQEQHGALPSESLAELVVQRARQNPTAFAVVSPEGTFTFGEVLRRAELLATCLLEHAQPIYVDNRSRSASGASRSGSAEFGAVGSVA
ncbi:Linear gramicidin synthase subunit D [Includes: ATP-dependent D-leucine adenylase (D-LeuA) (D-leucine activase), partial [Durusdinium trenchii]